MAIVIRDTKIHNSKHVLHSSSYFTHIFGYTGPYPFERWHNGGLDISEPNDGWCVEDCGGMRLDLSDKGRAEFTGVLTEFWNDFHCDLQLPFACEIGEFELVLKQER